MDHDLRAIVDIALALGLTGLVGLEREWRQKAAGLRTHTVVGVGAALFMVISKYGFFDVLGDNVVVDPSRVAAQIVSGIGFIGGGLIFVRRDMVRGLTTAATVWLAAAIGAAAGASLYLVAVATTGMYFLVVLGFAPLANKLPRTRFAFSVLRVTYEDGRGLLRTIVQICTAKGYFVADLELVRSDDHGRGGDHGPSGPSEPGIPGGPGAPAADTIAQRRHVVVLIELEGQRDPGELVHELGALAGVVQVGIAEGPGRD